jgi:hypothetical protein
MKKLVVRQEGDGYNVYKRTHLPKKTGDFYTDGVIEEKRLLPKPVPYNFAKAVAKAELG